MTDKLYGEDRGQRNRRTRDWHRNNPARSYMLAAKKRAKTLGVPFDLEEADISFPDVCPILGIPISVARVEGPRKRNDNTPSLDRKIPELGYVKGNVFIISWRANRLKNDAKLEELEAIVRYLKETTNA